MFQFGLKSIEFSGEEKVELELGHLVIIFGPNNSGKSTFLSEIKNLLLSYPNVNSRTLVIKKILTEKNGTKENFEKWLEKNFIIRGTEGNECYQVPGNAVIHNQIFLKEIGQIWERIEHRTGLICHELTTIDRLNIGNRKQSINLHTDRPQEYIHILQLKENILREINQDLKSAFGVQLFIDYGGGGTVWFRVGEELEIDIHKDRVSGEYLKKLNKMNNLEKEGDGIRSFVGCLLAIRCSPQPILLIDEPETFLYPYQARKLGEILAKNADILKRQIFIVTHSTEIIKGALSTNKEVSICKIVRNKNVNSAHLLNSKELKELWLKPLLQSSGAINGIFYEAVIVCEGDSDCRFYDVLFKKQESEKKLKKPSDIYFIHGGGKGVVADLVKSYKTLKMSTVAIVDFDILRNKKEFEKLYKSFEADSEKIENLYNEVKNSLDDLPSNKSVNNIVQEIRVILNKVKKTNKITFSNKEKIGNALNETSEWYEAKKYGVLKLKGDVSVKCKTLLEECRKIGLFIVPNGDLESWWRSGPSNKERWILEALEKIYGNEKFLEGIDDFISNICIFLGLVDLE